MTAFNIYHVKINEYYRLYEDLIRALQAGLIDLGHSCTVKTNFYEPDAVNILIGSTVFASRYHELERKLAGAPYIVYQLEALDELHGLLPEWPEYASLLRNATCVWDYAPSNMEFLRQNGFTKTHYLPHAFHRSIESFRPAEEPDIDVLLVGSPHERRNRIIEELHKRGLKAVLLTAAFGEQRNRQIARAKIVLNVHAWDGLDILETMRLSFLLANRCAVISETSDHNPYADGVVYAPYDKLPDTCVEYANQPPETRQALAAAGYLEIRKLDLVSLLRNVLADMGELEAYAASAQPLAETSYYNRARADIVNLVPMEARRILDIGCAEGAVGAAIKRRQDCHVTGIELLPEVAAKAAKALDVVIAGDAMQVLPALADAAYDTIIMADVLEHLADSDELMRLAQKKLMRHGVLLLCVPNVRHWSVVKNLLEGNWHYEDEGILDRTHLRFFTYRSLKALLDAHGFYIAHTAGTVLSGTEPPPEFARALAQWDIRSEDFTEESRIFQFQLICRQH